MQNESVTNYEDVDYGYDPTQTEPIAFSPLLPAVDLPVSVQLNLDFVPPVGSQGACGSCVAWAGIYGMVSYWAASNGGGSAADAQNQASPGFIFIQVKQSKNSPVNTCTGTHFMDYVPIIQQAGGTPNMATAPYGPTGSSSECDFLWSTYLGATLQIDTAFAIPTPCVVDTTKIEQVKQVLAQGYAIAYGTHAYTDFGAYAGDPVPYVGNRKHKYKKGTNPPVLTGHFMLIIGYDDTVGEKGALYVQNSFGTSWGQEGRFWLAYKTFHHLVQGQGFYLKNPS